MKRASASLRKNNGGLDSGGTLYRFLMYPLCIASQTGLHRVWVYCGAPQRGGTHDDAGSGMAGSGVFDDVLNVS